MDKLDKLNTIQNNTVIIRHEHMKQRCSFITIMCAISLYTWYNYSLFEPIKHNIFMPYYQNCLLFIFYLLWDTYQMTLSSNRKILFRNDLLIHHLVSFFSYSNFRDKPLQMSNLLIAECISLMNYRWRNHNKLLNLYRTFCILFIRFPLNYYFLVCYNPTLIYPFTNIKISNTPYCIVFFAYDMHILWQIYNRKYRPIKAE